MLDSRLVCVVIDNSTVVIHGCQGMGMFQDRGPGEVGLVCICTQLVVPDGMCCSPNAELGVHA